MPHSAPSLILHLSPFPPAETCPPGADPDLDDDGDADLDDFAIFAQNFTGSL